MIEKQDIKRYLPHREPFLFVDGVTEIIKDEYSYLWTTWSW